MKNITFDKFVGISSLLIASCAAYFSIIGIGMLFSGSAIAAMIMAITMEIGKLTATSFLYRNWNNTKIFLKSYLILAVFVLMIITSLGIFGYLTSAYQQSSIENANMEENIKGISLQKDILKDKISFSKSRIATLTQIRTGQEARLNQSMTNVVIASNPIQLRQIQQQTQEFIEQNEKDIESENNKIQKTTENMQELDLQVSNIKLKSTSKKDIMTFKFVADEFNVSVNKVVKWLIIALISVFDPLAICLLLAYNTTFYKNNNKDIDKNKINKVDLDINNDNINSGDTKIMNNPSKLEENIVKSEEMVVQEVAQPAPTVPEPRKEKVYPFSF